MPAIRISTGNSTGFVCNCLTSTNAPGISADKRRFERLHNFRRRFLVTQLNDDLRIIRLLLLRRNGEPKTRPSSPTKLVSAFNKRRCVCRSDALFKLAHHSPDNLLGMLRCFIGDRERRTVRQPDVDIRPILDVFWKELRFQPGGHEYASHHKTERKCEHCPAVLNRQTRKPVIESIESAFAVLFDGRFLLLRWPQNEISEQRDKGHRDQA